MNTPTYCPRRRSCDRGYTLIEMMVAVALLGVMLALAAPRLEGLTRANRLRAAIDRVSSDLTLARLSAVREGRQASLRIDDQGRRYTVTIDNADGTAASTLKTVVVNTEYKGVTLDPQAAQVSFDSRGMWRSGATSIRAIRDGRGATLTITGVGRINRDYRN